MDNLQNIYNAYLRIYKSDFCLELKHGEQENLIETNTELCLPNKFEFERTLYVSKN